MRFLTPAQVATLAAAIRQRYRALGGGIWPGGGGMPDPSRKPLPDQLGT
jgi:hypothetical protein